MKENKNRGVRKVLLMAISVALVAAVSVSATLAYLTAKTDPAVNTFTASGGITGEVIEPDTEFEKFEHFVPGEEIKKNPMIDNDTLDYDIWVGAKLEFQIDVGKGFTTVPYSTFSKYVTLNNWLGSGWNKYSASVKSDNFTYLYYNSTIKSEKTATGSGADSTETHYDGGNKQGGTTGTSTQDNTSAIFTSVTPSKDITIRELPTEEQGSYATINANGPQANEVYQKFNFKIIVTGYGVKAEATVSASEAQTAILKGLGGYQG